MGASYTLIIAECNLVRFSKRCQRQLDGLLQYLRRRLVHFNLVDLVT